MGEITKAGHTLRDLDGALRILARVHLRPATATDFVIMLGARPDDHVMDEGAYIRAWETVFHALGGVIE
jgi:hypothetical protein